MNLFTLLDGASPWWWIAIAAAIGVAEMLTFSYYMIWLALAALAVGGALWAMPGMGGGAQLALFAVLSILLTVAGRYYLAHRRADAPESAGLNERAAQMVGRTGEALGPFEHAEGTLMIDGVRWRARLTAGEAPAGRALRVTGAEGMTLLCEPA